MSWCLDRALKALRGQIGRHNVASGKEDHLNSVHRTSTLPTSRGCRAQDYRPNSLEQESQTQASPFTVSLFCTCPNIFSLPLPCVHTHARSPFPAAEQHLPNRLLDHHNHVDTRKSEGLILTAIPSGPRQILVFVASWGKYARRMKRLPIKPHSLCALSLHLLQFHCSADPQLIYDGPSCDCVWLITAVRAHTIAILNEVGRDMLREFSQSAYQRSVPVKLSLAWSICSLSLCDTAVGEPHLAVQSSPQ